VAERLPADKGRVVSLSSHLADRGSPVRQWLESQFPNTRPVALNANRELRAAEKSCAVPPPDGSDSALVGTAVDYLIRAQIGPDVLSDTVSRNAARFLSVEFPHAAGLEQQARDVITMLAPWDRPLDDTEFEELAVACLALARFEQWYRAGPAVAVYIREPLRELPERATARDLVNATVRPPCVADLVALGRAAVADHTDVFAAEQIYANPTFSQSIALGGADADLVCDGLLIDWKATKKTDVVGRSELWQLLGYAFADADDRHRIERVGISALRWRHRVVWPLDRLLVELAGGAVPGLADLRGEFANVLAPVAASRDELLRQRRRDLE
jgi:hypothetical protein